jgi:exonuclease III
MKGDKLTIATQNVRCLGQGFIGRRKRQEIKDIFKHTKPMTDILLLQEVKLPEAACLKQARFLEFKGGASLWNESTFSAQSGRFQGGTGIILTERLAQVVTNHGVLYPGRAQYVTLNLSARLHLGIINVYGFSNTGARAMLWNHIAQVDLPDAIWIVAGDFNNIEQAQDKQGGSNTTSISTRELEAWNKLLVRLGTRDSFHLGAFIKQSEKAFTWNNGHQDDSMIQSRIDRIYVPILIENIGGTLEILPTIQHVSDHAGVTLHFTNEKHKKQQTFFFNKGLLKNEETKKELLATWRQVLDDDNIGTWNDKIVAANHAIKSKSVELTKSQRHKWKDTYQAQFDDINAAESELQQNWGSAEAREQLSKAQAALHEVRQQKFQNQESAILSKWARVGGRCTKEFFEYHTGFKRPAPITQMLDGERVISNPTEIEQHVLSFYEQLYTMDEEVENNVAAREDCFSFIVQTVTEEQNKELLRPLVMEEVTEAVKQLPGGKAPGADTIPAEFYQELWEDLEFDIFNFVAEAINQAHISAELNINKIALLPKTADRLRIQNYRPISLLNTLYKVVAKVYANRMKPLLHHWILPSQTGFVPNRCILDNIFLAFEAIEWTQENNQDLSMLLLDFEKAYDRVNWTFLRQTMEKMGFEDQWITQVMSLNLNASASILVNGQSSKTFKLQRSVRQGCPLAPYLFLLTVDVLGQMLQHPRSGVHGLRLPDNSTITNQMFADDTLLFLDGKVDNMDRALDVITRFGAASGAKLNLHKSIGLWVAHNDRTWQWGEEAGLKWLPPGEVTRYLGYPFGLNIHQREKDNRMLAQIRKHLARWSDKKLSLAGRIMVSNQVILSSIWYLASCTDILGQALKIARATVRNFMWSGRKESKARARVKWATAVLPIVRGGIKILDPQWQASALLVKLLVRGLTVGYEPWKVLVRYRVAQTRQSRRGKWPSHANWIMNAPQLVKQGSLMWQAVMKSWSTIQSGLEQQDPASWSEIARQPLFGNRMLTNDNGIPWGMTAKSNMLWWAEKEIRSLQDIARTGGYGWQTLEELKLRRTKVVVPLYAKVLRGIPWEARPMPPPEPGQWLAAPERDGTIQQVYQILQTAPLTATVYHKEASEQLKHTGESQLLPEGLKEVRVVRSGGPKRAVIDFNPKDETEEDQALWLWGNQWVSNLEWDPKEWNWRRLGILPDTNILNYTTKRGYRVALRQDNNRMSVDVELEEAGFNSKTRAKFFNRIWHPYLPRKVSACQWLILTGGLPVGAWRERIGLPSDCQICPTGDRETLQHAFQTCVEVEQAWDLFRQTRAKTHLRPAYHTWKEISRGLLTEPDGPSMEEDLRWDTASSFTINTETPWDTLRAQLLWSIWCQRVAHAFSDEHFHLGVVLWHAWRNTIYCAMEAYKELFRHKRNEGKKAGAYFMFSNNLDSWKHLRTL